MRCVEAGSRRDRGRAGCAAARDECFGRERGRRRRPASESPVAPRYGRGARAGPSLAPAAAAAARGRSRREDGRPARAAVVGSATPRARPQPQLPRHTPPLTTVRAQQSACCCHAAALLAATRRPRPLSPFSRGWPYGALVASIFKSCMVLVQIGVSANYPPPRARRVCAARTTPSLYRARSLGPVVFEIVLLRIYRKQEHNETGSEMRCFTCALCR